jgi:glycosyltransferase involved in cell wall biosynthesis
VNFLFDIINNIKPKVLHVINSDLCYQMLKKYGLKVAEYSRIYDSQFCLNVSEEGFYTTFPTVYLKDHSHITAVFSENKNYLKDLKRIYNFPEDKFHCHYAPTPFHNIGYDNERLCMKIKNNEKLKILWAGRICTQKRPDILLKIAEKCKDLHVHFDIWGRFTDSYSQYDFSAENISYKGAFDGWTFSNKDYDLFIYTSMTDGMPNIILECLSGYMPVLTSNSGGVSEVIKHCETGFLVNEMDNIDEYVNIIKLILEKPQILEKIVLNGAEVIKTKFSWSKFINEVQKEREYTLIERLT